MAKLAGGSDFVNGQGMLLLFVDIQPTLAPEPIKTDEDCIRQPVVRYATSRRDAGFSRVKEFQSGEGLRLADIPFCAEICRQEAKYFSCPLGRADEMEGHLPSPQDALNSPDLPVGRRGGANVLARQGQRGFQHRSLDGRVLVQEGYERAKQVPLRRQGIV